jgi:exonuclease 3'-5' domain-containing protein 1
MAPVAFIATTDELASPLATLKDLPILPPSLYIDLEGVKLSRNGTISLLTLYVLPQDTVYITDIHNLGADAFSTPAAVPTIAPKESDNTVTNPEAKEPPLTLKSILQDANVPKVFFDSRNDSDALFAHFGIRLQCIHDIQLMDLATTTRSSRDYLSGLSNCIRWDSGIAYTKRMHAQSIKEAGTRLFAPERGGSYEVFNERPLKKEVEEYCAQDVVHIPKLWLVYDARSDDFWREMCREGAAERVKESQTKEYVSSGEHKRYGCWSTVMIKKARKKWDGGVRSGLCGWGCDVVCEASRG